MTRLGFLEKKKIDKELLNILKNDGYEVNLISKNEQLIELDGIVLFINHVEDFPNTVEWLLACQKIPSLFVWVVSTIDLNVEKDIVISLGANGVFSKKDSLSRISLLISNSLSRLEYFKSITNVSKDDLLLNPSNQSVKVNQFEQPLTRKEYQLLNLLYENRDECVSYQKLIMMLWPNSRNLKLYNLTNTIFHLREKIKNSEHFTIKTIRSKGYMLTVKNA